MRKRYGRRAVLAGVLALGAAAGTPLAAQSIAGSYRAEGRNPDGSTYAGTVQISEHGSTVQMRWQIGAQSYAGSGSRTGDVIRVNWGQPQPVVYVLMPGGELHGTWAGGRALERLIP